MGIAHEAACAALGASAVAVRHTGGPLDVVVTAHVVDERHEAVVEDREISTQDFFGVGIGRASGVHGVGITGAQDEEPQYDEP